MPVSEAVLTVVREWIVKADHDLMMAAHILKLGKAAPVDIICFHAQQCVEKYLKAILVYRSLPFPGGVRLVLRARRFRGKTLVLVH